MHRNQPGRKISRHLPLFRAVRIPSTVERRFELGLSLEEAFAALSNPQLLNRLTPGWFDLEILDLPEHLGVGATIDYRLRWRILKLSWRSVITEWRPPELFTYEQARGPFRSFSHVHLFRSGPESTEIIDHIDFLPPRGLPLASLLEKEIERILDYRASASAAVLSPAVDAPMATRERTRIPLSRASSSAMDDPR